MADLYGNKNPGRELNIACIDANKDVRKAEKALHTFNTKVNERRNSVMSGKEQERQNVLRREVRLSLEVVEELKGRVSEFKF